ncbi:Alpha/Beta hydrolase protein [Pyronema omphalodes]|nr:Alpha/Beta hydrolase protein [Pyronema omphalodes]
MPRPRRTTAPHGTSHTLHLFIPSLHDNSPLEASITVPLQFSHREESPTPRRRKAAVFAHPYGPLGGNFNDGCVVFLRELLVSLGFVVATFNFRGVGRSRGNTSWTGRAETGDYAGVLGWVVSFVAGMRGADVCGLSTSLLTGEEEQGEENQDTEIGVLTGGYSYGGLIAAQSPSGSEVINLITSASGEYAKALKEAREIAEKWQESHSEGRTSYSSPRTSMNAASRPHTTVIASGAATLSPTCLTSPASTPPPMRLDLRRARITRTYLLISPPLPPVSSFLLPGWLCLPGYAVQTVMEPATLADRKSKMLCVWGDEDVFTGVKRYRKWAERMGEEWFHGVEVAKAGHFWRRQGLEEVKREVEAWISG